MNEKLSRRAALASAAAFALAPGASLAAGATPAGLRFTGHAVQGGLVIGRCGTGNQAWVDGKPVRVQNGLFCFGFGRDATAPAVVKVRYPRDYEETREIVPRKRTFAVQAIDGLPERYVSPPKDVLDRIARDAKAVAEARSHDLEETYFADGFAWPAEGPISGVYGSQRILNGKPREPHYGLDIAAPEGAPILAPVPGIVMLAEELYLSGKTMIIDHGHGVSTSYLHMSRQDVKAGDRVEKGQPIGLVGRTGRVTGPHLCWRLNWFQTRLDVALLAPPRTAGKT